MIKPNLTECASSLLSSGLLPAGKGYASSAPLLSAPSPQVIHYLQSLPAVNAEAVSREEGTSDGTVLSAFCASQIVQADVSG